jgi:hypothetical protein
MSVTELAAYGIAMSVDPGQGRPVVHLLGEDAAPLPAVQKVLNEGDHDDRVSYMSSTLRLAGPSKLAQT